MGRTCIGRGVAAVSTGVVSKQTGTPTAPTARDGELRVTIAGFEWRHLPTSSASVDPRWAGSAICRQDCSRNCRECGSLRGNFGGSLGGKTCSGVAANLPRLRRLAFYVSGSMPFTSGSVTSSLTNSASWLKRFSFF